MHLPLSGNKCPDAAVVYIGGMCFFEWGRLAQHHPLSLVGLMHRKDMVDTCGSDRASFLPNVTE